MNKTYVGSAKLRCNFKMFRVKYKSASEVDKIKAEIMSRMNEYLRDAGGKLVNVKELKSCNELLFYFISADDEVTTPATVPWDAYLKNDLLKEFSIMSPKP